MKTQNQDQIAAAVEADAQGEDGEKLSHYARYKEAHLKYQNSEKGKAARERYQSSEKGKAARKRYQKTQQEQMKEMRRIIRESGLRGEVEKLS